MSGSIDEIRRGIAKAAEMAREIFEPNSTEFAVMMCGVLAAAFDSLAEHVDALENLDRYRPGGVEPNASL
jgi:hypothetical protein